MFWLPVVLARRKPRGVLFLCAVSRASPMWDVACDRARQSVTPTRCSIAVLVKD